MKKIFILILWPTFVFAAGGGSIVGNGAGLSEQNVVYAYNALVDSIDHCLTGSPNCVLSETERTELELIRKVRVDNSDKTDMIQFISEKTNPDFFELSVNEQHRIAKTGLTPNDPIWFNADLLYTADGKPAIDFALATAILIHEVGHQTGNTDHTFLDGIGSKVRLALEQKQMTYSYDSEGTSFAIQVFNLDNLALQSQTFFKTATTQILLNPQIVKALTCPQANSVLAGFQVWNGHWDNYTVTKNSVSVPFKAWVSYSCIHAGLLQIQKTNLQMTFSGQDLNNLDLVKVSTQ